MQQEEAKDEEKPKPEMSLAMRAMYETIKKVINEELKKTEEEYGADGDVTGFLSNKKKIENPLILNKKSLEVINRIKQKLMGRDFNENQTLDYKEQVSKLINQATNQENIAVAYRGWCPFW